MEVHHRQTSIHDSNQFSSKNYYCYCGLEFKMKREQVDHIRITHNVKFKCSSCEHIMFNDHACRKHIVDAHGSGFFTVALVTKKTVNGCTVFECSTCHLDFMDIDGYRKHCDGMEHYENSTFYCDSMWNRGKLKKKRNNEEFFEQNKRKMKKMTEIQEENCKKLKKSAKQTQIVVEFGELAKMEMEYEELLLEQENEESSEGEINFSQIFNENFQKLENSGENKPKMLNLKLNSANNSTYSSDTGNIHKLFTKVSETSKKSKDFSKSNHLTSIKQEEVEDFPENLITNGFLNENLSIYTEKSSKSSKFLEKYSKNLEKSVKSSEKSSKSSKSSEKLSKSSNYSEKSKSLEKSSEFSEKPSKFLEKSSKFSEKSTIYSEKSSKSSDYSEKSKSLEKSSKFSEKSSKFSMFSEKSSKFSEKPSKSLEKSPNKIIKIQNKPKVHTITSKELENYEKSTIFSCDEVFPVSMLENDTKLNRKCEILLEKVVIPLKRAKITEFGEIRPKFDENLSDSEENQVNFEANYRKMEENVQELNRNQLYYEELKINLQDYEESLGNQLESEDVESNLLDSKEIRMNQIDSDDLRNSQLDQPDFEPYQFQTTTNYTPIVKTERNTPNSSVKQSIYIEEQADSQDSIRDLHTWKKSIKIESETEKSVIISNNLPDSILLVSIPERRKSSKNPEELQTYCKICNRYMTKSHHEIHIQTNYHKFFTEFPQFRREQPQKHKLLTERELLYNLKLFCDICQLKVRATFYRKHLMSPTHKFHLENPNPDQTRHKRTWNAHQDYSQDLLIKDLDPRRPVPHVCDYCRRKFYKKHTLELHMRIHTRSSYIHKCTFCDDKFLTLASMMSHRKKTHATPDGIYSCSDCKRTFSSHQQYTRHCTTPKHLKEIGKYEPARHTKPPSRKHTCYICNTEFCNHATYQKHYTSMHAGSNEVSLKRRKRPPAENLETACRMADCGREFSSHNDLQIHYIMDHDNSISFGLMSMEAITCQCGRIFRKRTYRPHVEKFHPTTTLCEVCGRNFSGNVKAYIQHRDYAHLPYLVCDFCGIKIQQKPLMWKHIKTHLENYRKKFVCEFCGHGFPSNAMLFRHTDRVHAGRECTNVFRCDLCPRKYGSPEMLRKHKIIVHIKKKADWVRNSKEIMKERKLWMMKEAEVKKRKIGNEKGILVAIKDDFGASIYAGTS